ncbi:MAG TPA: triose-phosphate isomerase [Gemmatimonadales bacterium]|nr:triose-phosphate isomerase [Gemmatimonadales bacterium]
MRRLLFAANWKMHLAPPDAREYCRSFATHYTPQEGREVWFFPPAVSIEAVAQCLAPHREILVGAQDVYWEPRGAFTGAISAPLAAGAGARAVLVGHSERRRLFGESDADTAKKVRAVLGEGLAPLLCVGEKLEEREAGATLDVVTRQLQAALAGLDGAALERVTVAYEPVWAIGTGRNAAPADAAPVHRHIRAWLSHQGARTTRVLYGGSVNLDNVAELLAERELDGVLVGGASLDPVKWAQLVRAGVA